MLAALPFNPTRQRLDALCGLRNRVAADPHTMTKDTVFVSPRATAIAKGLAVTGRAGEAVVVGSWLKAQARRGNRYESYFVDIAEGRRLLRGLGLGEATELTPEFATTMAIIGKRGMAPA
jgi:hypothetical protein